MPSVSWPEYPDPWPIIFLDEDGKIVIDEDTEIIDVKMPYWYFIETVKYKQKVDAIKNVLHPP